jgi:hypothetical protein
MAKGTREAQFGKAAGEMLGGDSSEIRCTKIWSGCDDTVRIEHETRNRTYGVRVRPSYVLAVGGCVVGDGRW